MPTVTRQRFVVSALSMTVGIALSGASAWAGQDRSNTTGTSTGTAVSRSGGDTGGGSAVSRGGDSGGSSSSSSSRGGDGGSMGSSSSPSPAFPAWGQGFEAPSRAQSSAPSRPRSSSGSGSSSGGDRAVSRNGGNSGGSAEGRTASSSGRSGGEQSAGPRNGVPTYSRPRDGQRVTGQAVDRVGLPPGSGGNIFIYSPYYYPYGFWGSGYGYGLGYMYFDPFLYNGFGYGYGYPGYGGYGYGGGGYGGGGYGYSSSQRYRDDGSLRLKIDPRHAQVYIDGYYVGVVDSFDGAFQKLGLESGGHRVELKAEGYETLEFEVLITAGETVTYKGNMKRIP